MTVVVTTPRGRWPERDYILRVVLGDFLGLPWRKVAGDGGEVRITVENQVGEIRFPDILFSLSDASWLTPASMPQQPLLQWDTRDWAEDITLIEPIVPVIYGDPDSLSRQDRGVVMLPIDIFGSAFFMLARYEELVTPDRDEHDRFPAWASVAFQEKFLDRPIVDEYVEILWAAMSAAWPRLQRRQRTSGTFVTCDVDNPYSAYTKTWKSTVRKMGGDIVKRRRIAEAGRSLRNMVSSSKGDYSRDPLWTFEWMMDVNEAAGNRMAFFFLCGHTVPGIDGHYRMDEPRIRRLLHEIHGRGHEIGLHGSYGTYRDPAQMTREADKLRRTLAEEGIDQPTLGARQHYLRWQHPDTAAGMVQAGVHYDTTLGYADRAGFRCGTSHPYQLFDLLGSRSMNLTEKPLVMMECSVLGERYMGLGPQTAGGDQVRMLKERSARFGGVCTLLWHNSWFHSDADAQLYSEIVS